jgi:hypothetical protein
MTFRTLKLAAMAMLIIAIGCGGGGGKQSAEIHGSLSDSYGAIIDFPQAVVSLDETDVIGHPDAQGDFSLTAEPGVYTLRGLFIDSEAGTRLEGVRTVNLVLDKPLNVGAFEISDVNLQNGWEYYRTGAYSDARKAFNSYLNTVRSGQSSIGSASAYAALGWTVCNGLNLPTDAAGYYQSAIDGWSGNVDAWAGLAGIRLGLMKSGGAFQFTQSIQAVTSAIDLPGEYSSAPTHDKITETDLKAFRAFVNLLNGNNTGARDEAQAISQDVSAGGNDGSKDAVKIVLEFTK